MALALVTVAALPTLPLGGCPTGRVLVLLGGPAMRE